MNLCDKYNNKSLFLLDVMALQAIAKGGIHKDTPFRLIYTDKLFDVN